MQNELTVANVEISSAMLLDLYNRIIRKNTWFLKYTSVKICIDLTLILNHTPVQQLNNVYQTFPDVKWQYCFMVTGGQTEPH